jgi:predicted CXXCH cytochrome family protein
LAAGPASASIFKLLVPFDGAVVKTPYVLAVCTTLAGVRVGVEVDGETIEIKDTPVPGDEEALHHVRIPLTEGRHRIRWFDAGAKMELGALTVTYIPPHSLRTATSAGDRGYSFHTKDSEAVCRDCHSFPEKYETIPDQPLAPAGKVCGACHRDVEKAAHLHGPVAVYSCFRCHDQNYSPARFSWRVPQGGTCESCHESYLSAIIGANKYVHGPVAVGICVACHDPHGGPTANLLRREPPGLCLLCHADTLPLPAEKGLHGQMPCTRCHDSHGGKTRFLTSESGTAFCSGCHEGTVDKQTVGHPIPGHPVEAKVDPSHPGTPMGCTSCHDVHGLNDVSRQGISKDQSAQKQFCRKCHY